MIRRFTVLLCFASALLCRTDAHAQKPPGSVTLDSSKVFTTTSAGTRFTCGKIGSRWLPGAFVARSRTLFLSFKAETKNIRSALKKATGKQKAKLLARQAKLAGLSGPGAIACGDGPTSPLPLPTPTPPSSGSGNFDNAGNVTAVGKALFGIPSNLAANTNTGKSIFDGLCRQCHSTNNEPLGKRYSSIKFAIENAPMFITKPDSELAHLTAYLNRYRR